jgi:hypothetical protein
MLWFGTGGKVMQRLETVGKSFRGWKLEVKSCKGWKQGGNHAEVVNWGEKSWRGWNRKKVIQRLDIGNNSQKVAYWKN